MAIRKRKHPGDSPLPSNDNASPISGEPDPVTQPSGTPEAATPDMSPSRSKRRHPGDARAAETQADGEGAYDSGSPPLSDEERAVFINDVRGGAKEAPRSKLETPPFLKRTLVFLLVVGFGLLGFLILLETVQAIDAILRCPSWIAWPLVALILGLLGYVLVRLGVLLVRLRRLPVINRGGHSDPRDRNASEPRALRLQLLKHLDAIAKQESAAGSLLAHDAHDLIASADDMPINAWLEQYHRKIQEPLVEAAGKDIRNIALAAGVSAVFSPWRLLDTLIAFNASVEAAQCALRRFGIRPDITVTVAFAFDTFLTTFFAAAVDEITEDLAKDLQERLGGEFVGTAVGYLGPKLAQGIGIAYFVRRLGRRMIRRLEPVRLSDRD